MKHVKQSLMTFLILLLGVIPVNAQDYKKCVLIETVQGEALEYYISASPRFNQDNDKVTLTSDVATLEFDTESIKKVYVSEADFKITYMLDGEVYKVCYHHAGVKVNPEPALSKEGCQFSGWLNEPTVMPANDLVVTGSFSLLTYKLTYQVDGVEYKSYDVEFGKTITQEPNPTKEGYTFSGWSEIPETMPAHDVTVTGSFSINKYKLVYKVDNADYKSYEIEYGATITPEPVPTKEGYTFSGWNDVPETMPAHDVTVSGSFSINKYKLTYMVDGTEYKSYEVEYGVSITAEAEPTKEGYNFSGWSLIPETMPAHDVIVTGTFSKGNYKLTYLVDGETYKVVNYDFDEAITPEPAPTKEGYSFSGWNDVPETMPAHDVTVTGSFSINNYIVTYMIDGNVYLTENVEYGAKIVPPSAPTRDGFDFAWDEHPETMPAHDITINGTYTPTTGINKVYSPQGNILLSGLMPGEHVMVFNLNGERIIDCQASAEGQLTISLSSLSSGVYVIKTNRQTFKVTRK